MERSDSKQISRIRTMVEVYQEAIVQDLSSLVSIESVTFNEGRAVHFLAGKMKAYGYDEVRIDRVGNVLGRVGHGPCVILYDAHIDTVSLGDEKEWEYPPLSGQLAGGAIHGRGACDDKGCLMAITWAGRIVKELGLANHVTLWVSGSVSEEAVVGASVEAMLKENDDIKPDFVLVAEASGLRIMRGHKGRALLQFLVPGKAAHASAAWRGDNALVKALPIIKAIDDYQDFPEDPFLGKGSIEVTCLECKTPSLNTIPSQVIITCDRRTASNESLEDLLMESRRMDQGIEGVEVRINTEHVKTYSGYEIEMVDYLPSWVLPENHPLVQAGVETFRDLFSDEPVITKWSFCTNATHFCGRLGIPSIGFGPGDEALCHSNRDRVPVNEYLKAIQFYAALPLYVSKHAE